MLGRQFETQPNALNAVRLALAATVVVWHARILLTHEELPWPILQLIAQIHVDAFFAISGFLIVRSWQQRPGLKTYLLARATRLLPGLWGCLVVTAFVIAPLAAFLGGHAPLSLDGRVAYVVGNMTTWVGSQGIDGGLAGDFGQGQSWNGALWTLFWESSCYIAVAVLGLCGLLVARTARIFIALGWALGALAILGGLSNDDYGFLRMFIAGPRLVFMFAWGALFWFGRDRIPVTRSLAAASAALILIASFTPSYRLLAAPAIVYLCLWAGLALGRYPRLRLRHDFSYGTYLYGWPLQHMLLMAGFTASWALFSIVSLAVTVPVAAGSWFFIEGPAMRLRHRLSPGHVPRRGSSSPEIFCRTPGHSRSRECARLISTPVRARGPARTQRYRFRSLHHVSMPADLPCSGDTMGEKC